MKPVRAFALVTLAPAGVARYAALGICTIGLALSWACGGSDTPPALQCDPPVVSQMYNLSIGCGTGGNVTLETTANSCAISVANARTAQIPFTGSFITPGDGGTFLLGDGHWVLNGDVRFTSNPPNDENVYCTVTPGSGGTFDLSCSIENCTTVGEGEEEGESCTSDVCMAVLTPGFDDGGSPSENTDTDAGDDGGSSAVVTTMDSGSSDAGIDSGD